MTGKAGNGSPGEPDDDAASLQARRRRLAESLDSRRLREPEDRPRTGSLVGVSQGLRISSEFVAGVIAGAVVGWLVDRLAGTSPWGLIIFLLLGFAAGVLNVLRSIGAVKDNRPKLTVERDDKIE